MDVRCYDVKEGTIGFVKSEDGGEKKMLFPTEDEYYEYVRQSEEEEGQD